MMKRILCAVAVVCLLAAAGFGQTVTVTANLRLLTGTNVTSGAYFQFTLKAFNGNPVRMIGQGWIDTKPIIARPDAQGNIAQTLQGNDTLTSYTVNDTYYMVEVFDGGARIYGAPFKITGQPSYDLNIQSPLSLTPPTGVLPQWWVPMGGGTMTGRLFLSGDPTSPMGAATKQYVDNQGGGGGGTSVHVNGSNVSTPNFGGAPAAQSGYLNMILQVSGSNVSIEAPWGTSSSTFARGDLVVPMDGSGNATIVGTLRANQVQTTGAAPWSVTGAFGTITAAPASNSKLGFGPSGFPFISINGATPQGIALLDGSGNVVENANTATKLAAAGSACSGSFATGVDAFGNALCSTATYIQLPWQTCSSITGVSSTGQICFDQGTATLQVNINNTGWTQFIHANLFNTSADILEEYNGTTAQTFNIYGTRTDASNYERLTLGYDGTDYVFGSAAAGTGQGRPVAFKTGSTKSWEITALSAHAFRPLVDNTYDIGDSTHNIHDLYLKDILYLGTSAGTAGQCPVSGGAGVATAWGACGGGGSMTWPAGAGIAVYAGGSAWGTSLTAPTGAIVGISDSQTLSNKAFGSGMTWPTFNQNTTGTAGSLTGCTPTGAGDICYYTGATWTKMAGNTVGTLALVENASGVLSLAALSGSGTVTSVGLTQTGSVFTITGTPVTTTGNLNIAFASGAQRLFLATPNAASGPPTLRAIIATDVPLLNQSTTGTAGGLSAPVAEALVTSLTTDLAARALTTTTVNGHALSANVVVSASDLTTGTLPHARLPLLLSADIVNNAANTSGTAGGLSANITESQVTNLIADLGAKAPSASPAFTGTISIAGLSNGCLNISAGSVGSISCGATPTWGGIGGTLSSQTDLQAALNAAVHIAGAETITGAKIFSANVVMNGNLSIGGTLTLAGAGPMNFIGPFGVLPTPGTSNSGIGFGPGGAVQINPNNTGWQTIAIDSAVVHNTGTEAIAGLKTFSNDVTINGNLNLSGTITQTGGGPNEAIYTLNATALTQPASGSSAWGFGVTGNGKFMLSENGSTLYSVTDALALKAPLASPTFTGTPAAPTPGSNVNTTQVPTTAWVNTYYAPIASPTFTGTVTIPGGASISGFATLASPTFTGTPAAPTPGSNVNTTQLPTTAWVNTYYAPLASPALTGTPTVPTAAVDTNTTQAASTAYVLAQASASGDGTPAIDGTAARGSSTHYARADHVHPTDTTRAPLASPTFTGTPAAPTPGSNVNTTQVPTTAWVNTYYAPLASPTFTGTPVVPGYATTGTLVSGNYVKASGAGAVADSTVLSGPYASAWLTYPTLGSGTPTTGGVANKASLWGVVLPFALTTTKVTFETITGGTSGGTYDIGIIAAQAIGSVSAGTVVAHTGNLAEASNFTGTNTIHTLNWTGTTTLQPGKYYVAITCSATALCATFGGASSNGVTFLSNTTATVSSGGTLSTITPPADSMSYGSAIPVLVVQ